MDSAGRAAWAQVGGEFAALEQQVGEHPSDAAARQRLAGAYAERGFVEEAVAQYLELAAGDPDDLVSRQKAGELIALRMPMWLSGRAEAVAPFRHCVLEMASGDRQTPGEGESSVVARPAPGGPLARPASGRPPSRPSGLGTWRPRHGRGLATRTARTRLLVKHEGLPAGGGYRQDRAHRWPFSRVDYGYLWSASNERWVMGARAHWDRPEDAALAQSALRVLLAFCAVGEEHLAGDLRARADIGTPAPRRGQGWEQPMDVWLCQQGQPGARSIGRDIYLYSTGTARAPTEWFRELAHECGHVAFPGVGGFTDSDDPWADGCLAELLFPKWLCGRAAEWLPWAAADAEREAGPRRQELIARVRQTGPDQRLLAGADAAAREHFVGLALWVEEAAGPRLLGEALAECRRGRATQFVAAVESLAAARCVQVWPAPRGTGQRGRP